MWWVSRNDLLNATPKGGSPSKLQGRPRSHVAMNSVGFVWSATLVEYVSRWPKAAAEWAGRLCTQVLTS